MPPIVRNAEFYEFLRLQRGREVGRRIDSRDALLRVKGGRDVYTPHRSDAFTLAGQVFQTPPTSHVPHAGEFFAHFHPGGRAHNYDSNKIAEGWDKTEDGFGHVFYRLRGEGWTPEAPRVEASAHQHNVERHKKNYL